MLTKRQRINKQLRRLYLRLSRHRGLTRPVFIFGAQSSGTNMLLYTLGRSRDTEVINEIDGEAFVRCRILDDETISQIVGRSRAKVVFFKAICDSQNARRLLDAFPDAKALWLYRSYNDVVNSALRRFHHPVEHVREMASGCPEVGWLAENVSEGNLSLLRRYLDTGLADESARALVWYVRNCLYFEQGFDRDDRVLVMAYEDIVGKPEQTLRWVCDFVGLVYKPRMIAKIRTTSVGKNPPPKLDPEVESLCQRLHEQLTAASVAPIGLTRKLSDPTSELTTSREAAGLV